MLKFRTLRADEIECRVGTCNEKGFSLLPYKDARCDMNILDETIGPEKWQRRHYEVKGNMFCSVGIDFGHGYVFKDDCGTESNTEKEKGEASDSFKRACFNWGIGRELYTAPFVYIKGNVKDSGRKDNKGRPVYVPIYKSFKVTEIAYDNGRITGLKIFGDKELIFEFDGAVKRQEQHNEGDKASTQSKPKDGKITLWKALKMKTPSGKTLEDLSDENLQWIIDNSHTPDAVTAAKLVLKDRADMAALPPLELVEEEDLPF